jgi:hypothetical protein
MNRGINGNVNREMNGREKKRFEWNRGVACQIRD